MWKKISVQAQYLVRCMLRVDPSRRLAATDVLANDWFNDPVVIKAKSIVSSYLVIFLFIFLFISFIHFGSVIHVK